MKPQQPEVSTQEVLAGLVERVTYHNADNGFCVLRAKARGHRDVVTVVGHAAAIAAVSCPVITRRGGRLATWATLDSPRSPELALIMRAQSGSELPAWNRWREDEVSPYLR